MSKKETGRREEVERRRQMDMSWNDGRKNACEKNGKGNNTRKRR